MKHGQHERRVSALKRLTVQLLSGVKTTKAGIQPLEDGDKHRIALEIEKLEHRTKA